MLRPTLDLALGEILAMLGVAVCLLWLKLIGVSVQDRWAEAALSATGYVRPRPDPAAEAALRAAFAELDSQLAAVLGDLTVRKSAHR
jgi:hypothetical protein